MTRYYWLVEDTAATSRNNGEFNATHRWKLPGLSACPGWLHASCIPDDALPPCGTCERIDLSRPKEPVLDEASLPRDRDMFRVGNFATMLVGTEQFREAVLRLGMEGIGFRELPLR